MKRAILIAGAVVLAASIVPGHAAPAFGETSVFARIGQPGSPEGILVRDGVAYVGTHVSVRGNGAGPATIPGGGGPSKIFRFDLGTGSLLGEIVIEGQDLGRTHGILAMAFDADGRLYVMDRNPGRIIRIDLVGGGQDTYATIPDLPACRPVVGPDAACAPVTVDEPTFTDYLAFDEAGNTYVTDLQAATIFRVPACASLPCAAEIWYQDPVFDGIFGLNGIALSPDHTRLYFAMTGSQQPGDLTRGVIYSLPVGAPPGAADLEVFHVFEPVDGPDGIAFGQDGKLYAVLAGANQVAVLDAAGAEIGRFPDAVSNAEQEIPYDLPASIAFDGAGSILVTNQSFFAGNADHWAVLRAWVDDDGLGVFEPDLP